MHQAATTDFEQRLTKEVASCYGDPLRFVRTMYPLVQEYKIRASMVPQWEEVAKELRVRIRKYRRPLYPSTLLETEDHRYVILTELEDLADFEKYIEANQAVYERARAAGEVPQARAPGALEYTRRWWIQCRPEWSYVPENPRLSDEEVKFVRWDMYYGGGGYRESRFGPREFTEELAFLYEVNDVPDGFKVYTSYRGTGPEVPFMIIERYGKDRNDFIEHARTTHELLGEEAHALLGKWVAGIRRVEKIDYTLRWDFSILSTLEPN